MEKDPTPEAEQPAAAEEPTAHPLKLWVLDCSDPAGSVAALAVSDGQPEALAIRQDGKLAILGRGRELEVWSIAQQARIAVLNASETVQTVAWNPDGKWLLSTCGNGTILLWNDVRSPGEPLRLEIGAKDAVVDCGGRWLATCDTSRRVRIWDLNAKMPARTSVLLPGEQATHIAFSGPEQLLTVGRSGLRRWDLRVESLMELIQLAIGRPLTEQERLDYFLEE